jgi:predicted transcriptional regulator
MSTVTITVGSLDEAKERLRKAFQGQPQGSRISFASPDLLLKVMTAKRWELLQAMTGAGPLPLREIARRLGRDVHAVHRDVHALLNAGVLRKTDTGQVVFPFDKVRAEFTLTPGFVKESNASKKARIAAAFAAPKLRRRKRA